MAVQEKGGAGEECEVGVTPKAHSGLLPSLPSKDIPRTHPSHPNTIWLSIDGEHHLQCEQ